jgi:nucleoside-diphosphate-sugar epimerase
MATAAVNQARTVFVTGFPVFAARRLIKQLVADGDQVWLLARDKFVDAAADYTGQLHKSWPDSPPVRILQGDILDIDLGLTGAEVRDLHAEVEEIHHIAAVGYLGTPKRKMRLVNVDGLREVMEVALGMKRLQRLCHWSTAFVAGARSGVVMEDELMVGQQFRNDYERTKAEAEVVARRAMDKLPISIVRPTIIVGSTDTGKVDRMDGIYVGIRRIVTAAAGVSVPIPSHGRFPVHVIPSDYAAKAAKFIARHPDAEGGTFHLTDPLPLTAHKFFDAVADAAGRPRPKVFLPGGVARRVLHLPGIRTLARDEATFVEWLDAEVLFDRTAADRILAPSGLVCPKVRSYVDVLVRFVRDRAA